MTYLYVQCVLRKGSVTQTAWIPLEFGILYKYVKPKNDKVWEDGWQVIEVGKVRIDQDTLVDRSQDYKRTRKASDI